MELFAIVIPATLGLATLLFGVIQWASSRRMTRSLEAARLAALYVNPLLEACEDLQSRLYNLLERNGVEVLSARHPDGAHASETLHLIARYFALESIIFRYGPYTRDAEVVRLSEAVREAFATSTYQVGPFCFFRSDQRMLAEVMLTRLTDARDPEFTVKGLLDFREQLDRAPFSDMPVIRESLLALQSARSAATLAGADRLRRAHVALVDLLEYIERQEGFSLFDGTRRRAALPIT